MRLYDVTVIERDERKLFSVGGKQFLLVLGFHRNRTREERFGLSCAAENRSKESEKLPEKREEPAILSNCRQIMKKIYLNVSFVKLFCLLTLV